MSANVAEHHDVDELVDVVHAAALADGLAAADALRTRAAKRDHYRVAIGHNDHAFVAIVARIGPGRSQEDKTRFLSAILDAAESHLGKTPTPLAIAWSAELQEINPQNRINRNRVRQHMQTISTTPAPDSKLHATKEGSS